MKIETKFDIGDLLRDKVTGLIGVVMAGTHYSTGCTHYGLLSQTLDEKGDLKDWVWLDETRLCLTKEKKVVFGIALKEKPNGGPSPNAPEG